MVIVRKCFGWCASVIPLQFALTINPSPLQTVVKHEGAVQHYPIDQSITPVSCVKSEFTSARITSNIYKNVRPIVFEDDLLELIDLDDTCKLYMEQFKKLDIIIKAVHEYRSQRGEMIEVKIKNNKWVIIIKNATEDLLLECIPIQELIPESSASRNLLDKYVQKATSFLTKCGIYVWTKTLAKYAKCTVTIHGNIKPDEEYITCSDVIINLFDLAEENKLSIERKPKSLLETEIIISEK